MLSVSRHAAIAVVCSSLAVSVGRAERATVVLEGLPLSFQENAGQFGEGVVSGAHGSGFHLLAKASGPVIVTPSGERARLRLMEGSKAPSVELEDPLPGVVSYFIGDDPAKWRTNIRTYRRIRYREVYPGIDLVLYGNPSRLEFDFEVKPGADPSVIAYRFDGAGAASIERDGGVFVAAGGVVLRQDAPVSYQLLAGVREPVESGFTTDASGAVRFSVGEYDRSRTLVVDPVLRVYSSYFGGSGPAGLGGSDAINDIAVDTNGNAYLTGSTNSVDLATPGAYDTECGTAPNCNNFTPVGQRLDAFVAKVSPDGGTLLYATYLGGSSINGERGNGIAVNTDGSVVVVGNADAPDFPATAGAADMGQCNFGSAAFVTKLNATGTALVYSTCIGVGAQPNEKGVDVAVDSLGNAYILGEANKSPFPTTVGAFQETCQIPQNVSGVGCGSDIFVIKLSADGSTVIYSTLLGGSSSENALGIAADDQGAAYVLGRTQSPQTFTQNRAGIPYPATAGVIQETCGDITVVPPVACGQDFVVTKLSSDGSFLHYSTHLGVPGIDSAAGGITLDGSGNVIVAANTMADDLPTTPNAYDTANGAGQHVGLIMELNATGTARLYSSYFGTSPGGSNTTLPYAVAVTDAGKIWLGGHNANAGTVPVTQDAFPLGGGISGGSFTGYLSKLKPGGNGATDLEFSTSLGAGPGYSTRTNAVAAACDGSAYAAGTTNAPTFPMTPGALKTSYAGPIDGFLMRVKDGPLVTFASNLNPVQFTVTNIKPGCNTGCEAGTYMTPKTLHWSSGAQCQVSFATIQNAGGGSRDKFVQWADGPTQSTRQFDPPPADATFTLNFVRQHLLTRNALPALGGSVTAAPTSGDNFYDTGTVVQLTSTPNSGYVFSQWSGSISGNANPRNVTMSAPRTANANFLCTYLLTETGGGALRTQVPAQGASFSADVQTGAGCAWTVVDQNGHTQFPGGAAGTGSGSVSITIPPNNDFPPANRQISLRTGAGGQFGTKTIAQATLLDLNEVISPGVYTNNGLWRMDLNFNGVFEPGVDRELAFGFAGATPFTGDWNGDGHTKAGLYSGGYWFLDYDGNGVWDGGVVDKQFQFGWDGVTPFVGDWNGDGKDTVGFFINGFWFLDVNGNGLWDGPGTDAQAHFGWNGVTPLVADWNGDGRDKIGIFLNGFWYLDANGNTLWDGPGTDFQAHFGWAGVTPLVGDWNGDGASSIGLYINGFWYRDVNGNGLWDGDPVDASVEMGWPGVVPVHGDWNGDGRDKIGVFFNGAWYLDLDGSGAWENAVKDRFYTFGQSGDSPKVGHW